MEFTKVGCSPKQNWWNQVWADAQAMEPNAYEKLGLIGVNLEAGKAKFQVRGSHEFLIDIK